MVGTAAAVVAAALQWAQRLIGTPTARAQDPQPTPVLYFPYIAVYPTPTPPPPPPVVHVRSSTATAWNGSGYFFNAVNQSAVDSMVQSGLQRLTGSNSWQGIWDTLFGRAHPGGYSPGQKIAIKINLNNSRACDGHGNQIDALPHPLLGLIKGMVAAGIQPSDIVIYDSIRVVPSYLRNPISAAYPSVQFVGTGGCTGVNSPGHGKDSSLTVQFFDPNRYLKPRALANVLYDATYVINMPILKVHTGDSEIPVTLGFKCHFGSLNYISASGNDNLHEYVKTTGSQYTATYNPLPDIYRNRNIREKTVLTLGDGLFGAFRVGYDAATSWSIFGGPANSLFFATDPVAVDCVMADLIVAQGLVSRAHAFDYLFYAQQVGLGVCEGTRSNPGGNPQSLPYGSGYSKIEYIRMDV